MSPGMCRVFFVCAQLNSGNACCENYTNIASTVAHPSNEVILWIKVARLTTDNFALRPHYHTRLLRRRQLLDNPPRRRHPHPRDRPHPPALTGATTPVGPSF